jgi:1,4-dihydroxy-2-naphthoate octaprenyltransferase
MTPLKFILGVIRAPFLALAPVCVVVGVGTAYWQTGSLNGWYVLLVFIGGLTAHITVNVFNEYFDFRSGLDSKTNRTPFSGGSGTLQASPGLVKATLALGCLALFITAAIGVFFVWKQGVFLILPGFLGLFLTVTYTTLWVKNPFLSLLAPGLGFGILMVMGTHFALTGTYTWTAFCAALTPTFLVSNLLLLNQFPDVEADRSIGRRHFPIQIGRKLSSRLYGIFFLLTYASILLGVLIHWLPIPTLIALLTVILAWRAYRGSQENAENIPALIPSMGLNVIIVLVTPVLLAFGLFIG